MEGYMVYWEENMPNNEWKVLREGAPQGREIEILEGEGVCDAWGRSLGAK